MAKSVLTSAANPSRIEILIYVDKDDNNLAGYARIAEALKEAGLQVHSAVGDPAGVPQAFNHLAEMSTGDILVTGSDDIRFVTPGWDSVIEREAMRYADGIYCLWCDDGVLGEKQCSFPIVSKTWVETLGYFHFTLFEHYCSDTWVHSLAKTIDRARYIDKVLIEHCHWSVGKAEQDDTYRLHTEVFPGRKARDNRLFHNFQRYLHVDAALLICKIEEHKGNRYKVSISSRPEA